MSKRILVPRASPDSRASFLWRDFSLSVQCLVAV
jgi:hypothetical protein